MRNSDDLAPDSVQKAPQQLRGWPGALALALLLSACCLSYRQAHGQSAQGEHSRKVVISGIVFNSVTHEPIARALVVSTDNRFATRTDDQGRFEFTFSVAAADVVGSPVNGITPSGPGGVARLMSMPGQLMARKPGFLVNGNGMVNVQAATPDTELTILLTPESQIIGRVTLASSDPSDRIRVQLYQRRVQNGRAHWYPAASVMSRSNGEFRFAELAAGTYKLFTGEMLDRDPITFDPRAQLFGYPPIYYPGAMDFATAGIITLSPGKTFQAELSPVRQPYYPIKVPVTTAQAGAPIQVTVSMHGHRGPGYSLGYNEGNHAIEGMLPNGAYTIEASSFGPAFGSGSLNITVRGGRVEGPSLTLLPNLAVSVSVKREFTAAENREQKGNVGTRIIVGERFLGRRDLSNVMLESADDFSTGRGGSLRPPSGPHDDSLVIDNVQPGRYWVRVDPSRGFVSALSSGGVDLLKHPLVLGHGGSNPTIEVTLRDDAAEIDGMIEGVTATLSGTGNAAVPGAATTFVGPMSYGSPAYVYCVPLPDSPGRYAEIGVSTDGKFSYQLPPGGYRVLAFNHPQPALEYYNPEAMLSYDSMGQVVRLVGGQKEHLQLQVISTSE